MGFHLPFFPLYAAETLADGRFQQWNLEERGAWITLLAHNWNDLDVPEGHTALARLLRVETGDMARIWSAIGDRFSPAPGKPGRLVCPRLEDERDKALALSKMRAEVGKKGANARWDKGKKRNGKRMPLPSVCHSPSIAEAMPTQCPRQSPSPPPSPSSDSQSVSLAGGLEGFRSKLEKRLGVPRLSVGKDADTVAACFSAQLDAVGEDALLEECCDLARKSTNGTPSSLAWFVGWLQRLPLPEANA